MGNLRTLFAAKSSELTNRSIDFSSLQMSDVVSLIIGANTNIINDKPIPLFVILFIPEVPIIYNKKATI